MGETCAQTYYRISQKWVGDDLGKTLIVCEKPSAAVKIASALAEKRPEEGELNGVPYYEFERVIEREKSGIKNEVLTS